MSFYNILFSANPMGVHYLKCLGISPNDIPRFRDCYLKDDRIVIFTQTGGSNRDYYESEHLCRKNFPSHFDTVHGNPEGHGILAYAPILAL